jgi:DNA mismatch endonuclease (patch repair protein)
VPKSNRAYWIAKLEGNYERGRQINAALRRRGWKVARVWECELRDGAKMRRKLAAIQKHLRDSAA